ncbi:hypothetical protein [Tepidibacter thalassicus]|uniref:Uncharacterized protein n=1 Tax=Tepidibacter thalassicus DSM 15285 TaxID=1123350 RepID=A0A1M5PX15_9FIRM|nr:hypothetical protein [Tepidibacter thalassicus]SHH06236.1 hypothetical protein SAMN02744040_00649 [Tepidibacter thalassicus DSM 15285]
MKAKVERKMIRTDVEKLKKGWLDDPCWDIEDTEGFEEYKDELLKFRLEQEKKWEKEIEIEEKEIDEKARELGIEGLYRLILEHRELLDRHHRAIEELADGNSYLAYRVLMGYEE